MSLPPPTTTIRPEGIEGELVPLISHDKQQARIPQTATLKKSVSGLHLPRLQQISTTQNLAGMPIFTAKLEFGKPTLT